MKPRRFTIITALSLLDFCAVLHARALPSIAIYLDFDAAPSLISVENMKREVASIMRPAGLAFTWRALSDHNRGEIFSDLVVIRFRGSCDPSAHLVGTFSPEAQAAALADTAVEDNRILSFGEVECDQVRRYIEPWTRGNPSREATLGRALGRIVAHEMYHMLLETRQHADRGVGRAAHSARELVAPEFTFGAREIEQLRIYARHAAGI